MVIYKFKTIIRLFLKLFFLKLDEGQITLQETFQLLKKHSYAKNIRISDNFFTLASKDNMRKIIELSPVKYRQYQKEIYDCDDFSFTFMGLYRFMIPNYAVGIIWSNTHAYNFFIDSDKKLWGIEPQTNEIFEITDKKEDIQLMII